jgi:hypothetical protein
MINFIQLASIFIPCALFIFHDFHYLISFILMLKKKYNYHVENNFIFNTNAGYESFDIYISHIRIFKTLKNKKAILIIYSLFLQEIYLTLYIYHTLNS